MKIKTKEFRIENRKKYVRLMRPDSAKRPDVKIFISMAIAILILCVFLYFQLNLKLSTVLIGLSFGAGFIFIEYRHIDSKISLAIETADRETGRDLHKSKPGQSRWHEFDGATFTTHFEDGTTMEINKNEITNVRKKDAYYILTAGEGRYFPIPAKAFASQQDEENFAALFNRRKE